MEKKGINPFRRFNQKLLNQKRGSTRHAIARHIFGICLIFALTFSTVGGVQAASNTFSKDYKAYPPGSPEDVVTKFIEYADLAKGANRQADERFPLFWSLTELSKVPDDSQRLIIKSYKIGDKKVLPSGDVIIGLKLDVRAIALSSCDPKAIGSYNYQRNNCHWRERTVIIHDSTAAYKGWRVNTALTEHFYKYVFGNDSKIAKDLLTVSTKPYDVQRIYTIPKTTRNWTFEIRLVKKKSKWLISQDSVPIEVKYIDEEIKSYKEMIRHGNEALEICEGRRVPDKNSFYFEPSLREKRCKANIPFYLNNLNNLKQLEVSKED